ARVPPIVAARAAVPVRCGAGGRHLARPGPLAEVAFFFSSRRRHTRSKRDWSSDVCSSDLSIEYMLNTEPNSIVNGKDFMYIMVRSEERRVGKECRSRWWPARARTKQQG